MTPYTKKQSVREAIIKAVPGIIFPIFGCHVKNRIGRIFTISGTNNGKPYIIDNNTGYGHISVIELNDDTNVEIIGRPITLADILLAVEKVILKDYKSVGFAQATEILEIVILWQKKNDNFDHQSEETIDFLYELLCGK